MPPEIVASYQNSQNAYNARIFLAIHLQGATGFIAPAVASGRLVLVAMGVSIPAPRGRHHHHRGWLARTGM
ncbi:TPA: hypothetical protein SI347_004708 [Escherichia coli]|nr:hypothetical protein [Escherichia coli]